MSTVPTTTITYQDQLQAKADTLTSLLSPFYKQALDVYPSPEQHYRMRAEFRVWHDGDDLYYIMFNKKFRGNLRVSRGELTLLFEQYAHFSF